MDKKLQVKFCLSNSLYFIIIVLCISIWGFIGVSIKNNFHWVYKDSSRNKVLFDMMNENRLFAYAVLILLAMLSIYFLKVMMKNIKSKKNDYLYILDTKLFVSNGFSVDETYDEFELSDIKSITIYCKNVYSVSQSDYICINEKKYKYCANLPFNSLKPLIDQYLIETKLTQKYI